MNKRIITIICAILISLYSPFIMGADIENYANSCIGSSLFHSPISEAEKALDAILAAHNQRDDSKISAALKKSWNTNKKDMVRKNCGEGGELCEEHNYNGYMYDPLICGQVIPDLAFYYTIKETSSTAIIFYGGVYHIKQPIAKYKMIKKEDSWMVDGIICYFDTIFHYYGP